MIIQQYGLFLIRFENIYKDSFDIPHEYKSENTSVETTSETCGRNIAPGSENLSQNGNTFNNNKLEDILKL